MAEIQISGYTVLVDDEDLERVKELAWHVGNKGAHGDPYFEHCTWKQPIIRLNRFIMGCTYKDGNVVDHIDGNTLDNRKRNLRICTTAENSRNGRTRKNNSGYKGVCYLVKKNLYRARITKDYKTYTVGYFHTPEEAYEARCKALDGFHGEFARP